MPPKKQQTNRGKALDRKPHKAFRALRPGRRVSKSGGRYTENRNNRADSRGKPTKRPKR